MKPELHEELGFRSWLPGWRIEGATYLTVGVIGSSLYCEEDS